MWCGKCQADVAAEVSADNQRVFCTVCGGLLTTVDVPPAPPASDSSAKGRIKDAHELLKRWSNQTAIDPFGPIPGGLNPSGVNPSGHKSGGQPPSEFSARLGDSVPLATLMPASPAKTESTLAASSVTSLVVPLAVSLSPLEPLSGLKPDLAPITAEPLPKPPIAMSDLPPVSVDTKATRPADDQPDAITQMANIVSEVSSRLTEAGEQSASSASVPLVPTESPRVVVTTSPLTAPLATSPIEPFPSPLIAEAKPSIGPVDWAVLQPQDQDVIVKEPANPLNVPLSAEPSSTTEPSPKTAPTPTKEPITPESKPSPTAKPAGVTRRIDPAHAKSRLSEGTLPMPPAQLLTGPFVDPPKPPSSKPPAPTTNEYERQIGWLPKWDTSMWRREGVSSGNWSVTSGQLLAYAGVLCLTIGGCMVVWSFFGGPPNYAQTGWLMATAGQMLLFFGVISLISGGLEQTTEQVNRRIEQLGDHIIRIEQAARSHGLQGTHFDPAADHGPSELTANERAVVEQ